MYASTDDRRFLERVQYMLNELEACQKANGNGYLLATKNGKRLFAEIEQGDIRYEGTGWLLNGEPEPYYAMEKLFSVCVMPGVSQGIARASASPQIWPTGSTGKCRISTTNSCSVLWPVSSAG